MSLDTREREKDKKRQRKSTLQTRKARPSRPRVDPGARWGSEWRKAHSQRSQSTLPSPNLAEQCPSPKDSNHLSQEELQTAACEAGVDFGECGSLAGGGGRGNRHLQTEHQHDIPLAPFPSVQDQSGVCGDLRLQPPHLLQHEAPSHHQSGMSREAEEMVWGPTPRVPTWGQARPILLEHTLALLSSRHGLCQTPLTVRSASLTPPAETHRAAGI